VFLAQIARQGAERVVAGHDVAEVGIGIDRQLGQGIARPLEDAACDRALDLIEEGRVAAEAPHHEATEKEREHRPPAPVVPVVSIEGSLFGQALGGAEPGDAATRMHQRQDPAAEEVKVVLELSVVDDAVLDRLETLVPEFLRRLRERGSDPAVRDGARVVLQHAEEGQDLLPLQLTEGRDA
jgi:hypothetical protein